MTSCSNTVNDNIESHQDRWWKLPPIKQREKRTVGSLINNPTPFPLLLPLPPFSGHSFLITIICSLMMISIYINILFIYSGILFIIIIIIISRFIFSLTHTSTLIFVRCWSKNFCKIQNSFFSKSLRYPNFLKTNSLMHFLPSEESKIVVRHFCSLHFLAAAAQHLTKLINGKTS